MLPPRIVANKVTEARDIHASERTFLSTVRISVMLLLSGGSLLVQRRADYEPLGLTITGIMLFLALCLPAVGFIAYERSLSSVVREEAQGTRESEFLSALLVLAALLGLASGIKNMIEL